MKNDTPSTAYFQDDDFSNFLRPRAMPKPVARQIAEVISNKAFTLWMLVTEASTSGLQITRGTKLTPLTIKPQAIRASTVRVNGKRRINPAPKKTKAAHTNRKLAMMMQTTIGYRLPALAIATMASGAPI